MPKAPSLANRAQRETFRAWLNVEREHAGCTKTALATALGQDSIQHVNKILNGITFPMPETLKIICSTIGISWPAAFAMAGYYEQLLYALADLTRLGVLWLDQDDPGATFVRELGVIRLRNSNPLQAISDDSNLKARYTVAYFEQKRLPIEIAETTPDGEPISPDQIERLRLLAEHTNRRRFIVLPKPMAAALLVATTGFPRRGDIYKDVNVVYAATILARLDGMIAEADDERLTRWPREPLPTSLQAAQRVLSDKSVLFDYRRPIAAEYVTAWADSVCSVFTFYARVAAFDYFGEAGSSMSSRTPYVHLPQLYDAELPDANLFG